MSAGLAIGASLATAYVLKKLSSTDRDHDDVLLDAYKEVRNEAATSSSIYTDHINVDSDGNTRSAKPGGDHHPDLVLTGFQDRNLVVEVETGDSLNGHLEDQLTDFRTNGYTRVLVVPDGVVDDGAAVLDEFDSEHDNVVVCGPSKLPDLL